jgi:hypothetical protein
MNQLDKIVFRLAVLAGVLVTAIGIIPVASAISADNISGLTGTMKYWFVVSCPTFLGMLVTW